MVTVKCNDLVRRQTHNSPFAHFLGTWEELEDLVAQNFETFTPGYKEGVRLVSVPPKGFYTSIVAITKETELVAKFQPRQEGEEPHITVHAYGPKIPAKNVDIVIYSHAVLAENNEATYNELVEWEIVSINARPMDEPVPMDPITMMRNQLHLKGGTKGEFTAEAFAKSILFWSQHALAI